VYSDYCKSTGGVGIPSVTAGQTLDASTITKYITVTQSTTFPATMMVPEHDTITYISAFTSTVTKRVSVSARHLTPMSHILNAVGAVSAAAMRVSF